MFEHFPELVIILVIGLIVFGPEKLPEMAANAGRMVREARSIVDEVMHPPDTEVADDFDTYYYESLARSGEEVPAAEEDYDFDDDFDGHEPPPELDDIEGGEHDQPDVTAPTAHLPASDSEEPLPTGEAHPHQSGNGSQ